MWSRWVIPLVLVAVAALACGSPQALDAADPATPAVTGGTGAGESAATTPGDPTAPASAPATAADRTSAASPAGSSPSAQPGTCAAPEQPPIQGGEHLIGDNPPPVPYSSTPPTSGWHSSGAFDVTVQPVDQPLSEPRQVSVLEAGGVVVTYNQLDEATRTTLEQHVRTHYDGRVAVTPYEQLAPGEVAFTAWGVLQRCEGLDLAALDAFVSAHAATDVTTGHSH